MSKSADAFRTISEVAEWLGVQAHVLRFWESKFTQVQPVKRAGGRRYYRPPDMLLLGGIQKLLHDDGLTIKGVQKILREEGMAHVSDMSRSLDDETAAKLDTDLMPHQSGDIASASPAVDENKTVPIAPSEPAAKAGASFQSEVVIHKASPARPAARTPAPPSAETTHLSTDTPVTSVADPRADADLSLTESAHSVEDAPQAAPVPEPVATSVHDPAPQATPSPTQDMSALKPVTPAHVDIYAKTERVNALETGQAKTTPSQDGTTPAPVGASPDTAPAGTPSRDTSTTDVEPETQPVVEPTDVPTSDAGENGLAPLPAFLTQPPAPTLARPITAPPMAAQAPEPETAPPLRPRIIDVPDTIDGDSFEAVPSLLTQVGQLTQLSPDQARALRPLVAQLSALRDRMAAADRAPH